MGWFLVSLLRIWGEGESEVLRWVGDEPKELALEQIGEAYARYRLHVPEAECIMCGHWKTMARSRRWWCAFTKTATN